MIPKKIIAYFSLLIALFIFSGCTSGPGPTPSSSEVEVKAEVEAKTETETDNELVSEDDNKEEETGAIEKQQQISSLPKMIAHYIDVGQADATLLEFNDEEDSYTMLIDTGNWNATDVVSYLQHEKITTLDIIAITHPHADHIGQLDKIMNTIDVGEVWMNGETANSDVFVRALAAIEKNGVDYYEPEVGEIFDIGPLEVAILHPSSLTGSTNNNSLAMRMQYGNIAFLFTGDAEEQAERDMVASGANLQADILHVGHHGSKTSTIDAFLNKVNPEIAIYSAGDQNQYGHPDEEVITRLKSNEILVYGTNSHGTIRIETDGLTYTVQTNKDGTIPRTATVPVEEKETEEVEVEETKTAGDNCVNINEADATAVQQIIHIGPERATLLIEARPYTSVEDLDKIKGIGPARIKDIKAQGIACVGG